MNNNPFTEFGGNTFAVKATLIANCMADGRTKTRLREHGTEMTAERVHPNMECLGGVMGVLFTAPDGWHGWLPADHLSIIRHDLSMDDWADLNAMEG